MSSRRVEAPSALQTGLAHAGISLTVLFGAAALGAGLIQASGDQTDAGPVLRIALFDVQQPERELPLKRRIDEAARAPTPAVSLATNRPDPDDLAEPSLGVEYEVASQAATPSASLVTVAAMGAEPIGVRINGREVMPGEALSEVEALGGLPRAPIAGLSEATALGQLPVRAKDGRAPADAYARPFTNRGNQPTVSIVLGGLGINYTHTKTAIEELPAEVTLSFAPHARGLSTWVRRARADGHEVLIELPLEPVEPGRVRPHPHTLLADLDTNANIDRLQQILALAPGFYGVINYQGDKFVQNPAAVRAMLEELTGRGLAFVEDGNLPGSVIRTQAADAGTVYAGADLVIDARIDADSMKAQLMSLEATARRDGAAFGTAIAYPLTIDILKEWTEDLRDKDVILAPASSLSRVPDVPAAEADLARAPVTTGSLQ